MLTMRTNKWLIGILFFAAVVRIAFVLIWPTPVVADAKLYDTVGWNLAQGKGFTGEDGLPSNRAAPAYPAFLATAYLIFGHSPTVVRILQALMGTAVCLFIFFIAKDIAGEKVALVASAIAALQPANMIFVRNLLTETLFTFLLALLVFILVKALAKEDRRLYLIVGLLLALLALCRAIALLYPLALFFVLWFSYGNAKKACKYFLVVLAAFLLFLGPWLLRTRLTSGTVQPVTAFRKGGKLWVATYPLVEGSRWWPVTDMKEFEEMICKIKNAHRQLIKERGLSDPAEIDAMLKREALKNIAGDPLGYVSVTISRMAILWFSPPMGTYALKARSPLLSRVWFLANYLVALVALVGLVLSLKQWKRFLPVTSVLLYYTFAYGVVQVIRRYGFPFLPLAAILTALGSVSVYSYCENWRMGRTQNEGG